MAVTTEVTQYAVYSDSSSNLDACLNGGEDYKTVSGRTHDVYGAILAGAGYCGNNISKACLITSVKVEMQCRTRTTSNNVIGLNSDCNYTLYLLSDSGVSGNKLNEPIMGATLVAFSETITESKNWQTVGYSVTISSGSPIANELRPAVKLVFWNGNYSTIRSYVKNLKFTVTRTRACYITFKGDGVTEKTTMYDYGTVPSYGSTPTRAGYTFKGWSNGSTTYSGTLPTAYEQDVTYTAVWERVTYYLDLNGLLDGSSSGSISPYGTADVYIKGSLAAKGVSDYYTAHPEGTTYEIKNIKANIGYKYNGNDSYSGTLTADTSVVLSFSTKTACTITYNGNGATSGSVAAQSGYVGDSLTLRDNGFYKKCIVAFYSNEDPSIEDDSLDELQPSGSNATFLGWYTAASGGSQVTSPYTPTSASVTLYAHWSGMSAVTTPTLTRDGYTFLGWYTARSGGSKVADGGSYTPSGTIALYAHWKHNEITDIYIGTSILDVYLGSSKVDVYQGTTKIYG